MRVWKSVCVVACLLVVILGYWKFDEVRADRQAEINVYNQWMQQMLIAQSYLSSIGHGERPKSGSFYQNPNAALIEADKYLNMAAEYAGGARETLRGRLSEADGYLTSIAYNLSQELGYMYDLHETYSQGHYVSTTPLKVLTEDRNFMQHQLSAILKELPQTTKNVSQITEKMDYLKQAQNGVGVFTDKYQQFMQSTGQMKQG